MRLLELISILSANQCRLTRVFDKTVLLRSLKKQGFTLGWGEKGLGEEGKSGGVKLIVLEFEVEEGAIVELEFGVFDRNGHEMGRLTLFLR